MKCIAAEHSRQQTRRTHKLHKVQLSLKYEAAVECEELFPFFWLDKMCSWNQLMWFSKPNMYGDGVFAACALLIACAAAATLSMFRVIEHVFSRWIVAFRWGGVTQRRPPLARVRGNCALISTLSTDLFRSTVAFYRLSISCRKTILSKCRVLVVEFWELVKSTTWNRN